MSPHTPSMEPSVTEPAPLKTTTTDGPGGTLASAPTTARRILSAIWRWSKRIGVLIAVVLLVARATIGLWLPKVANKAAAPYDLHVSWEDLDLSILGLSLDLVGVRVVPLPLPLPGSEQDPADLETYLATVEPLIRLDDLGVDADVSALLTGDLKVHRIEVGGLETWIARDEAGAWNFERHLPAPAEKDEDAAESLAAEERVEAGEAVAEAEPVDPSTLDFSSPVEISTIDLHGVRLHLDDAFAQPRLATVLALGASIRDVGHAERPVQVRVVGRADGVLDALLLELEATHGEAKLLVDLDLQVDGIGLRKLGPYLEPMGIVPSANKLNAHVAAVVDLAPVAPELVEGASADVLDLAGTITLGAVRVDADGEIAVELSPTTVKIRKADSTAFDLESVVVSGLRAQATRLPDGTLRVAGLDLAGSPSSAPSSSVDETEDIKAVETDSPTASPTLALDRLALENVEFTFLDETLPEPQSLVAKVSAEIRSVVLDPAQPGAPFDVQLDAALDGAAAIALSGSVVPTGPMLGADLALTGTDMTLATLTPYLKSAGLASTLQDGSMAGQVQVQLTLGDDAKDQPASLNAHVSDLEFRDGDQVHGALASFSVESMLTTSAGESTIERISLEAATLPIELLPGGAFRGFGLETLGLKTEAAGRALGLSNAGVAISDLSFGGAGSRATIEGSFDVVDIADNVAVTGSVETREGPLDVAAQLSISGTNVSFEGLREVLLAQGIEPDLENGELSLSVECTAKANDAEDTTIVNARIYDVAMCNRGVDVLAIKEAKVSQLKIAESGTEIESITVTGPRIDLARDSAGILLAAGLRIGVPAVSHDLVDAVPQGPGTLTTPPAGTPRGPATSPVNPATAAPQEEGGGIWIQRVALSDLNATWSDAYITPAVDTAFTAQAQIRDITVGPLPSGMDVRPKVQLSLNAALAWALDSLAITGAAELGDDRQVVQATLALEGLRAGPLASYLPESMIVTLEDGRLSANLAASADVNDSGGQALRATITELDYRDGIDGEPLLAFHSFVLDAPRIDADAAVYEIDEVSLTGFAFDAERVEEDRIHVLGLALIPPPVATDEPELSEVFPAPSAEDRKGGSHINDDSTAEAEGESPEASAAVVAKASAPNSAPSPPPTTLPPTVMLGKLDLGIDRLRYIDRTRSDAVPLDLSLAIVTPGPQVLCLPDPVELPAVEFSAVGAIHPIVENLNFTASLEPFAADPGAGFQLLIEGITGQQLALISPEAAAMVDPSAYVDGSFEVQGDARLAFARRGPLDFGLTRGFGATLIIDKFALKPTPDSEATGFDRLDIDVKRVDPSTGDIQITSIDLGGLYARVHQSAEGLTVAGLTLPNAPEQDESAADTDATMESGAVTPDPAEVAVVDDSAEAASLPPGPETSIDRLTVSGLDFEFLDSTVVPPMRVPIEDLQLEVQRFSTLTLTERRPFSFRLVVDAGEIELEERTGSDNLLFGVLNSAADAVTLQEDDFAGEQRRVWDLLEASGRLSLGPEPRGRVQVSLLGLELPSFRGAATAAGVDIGDGLLDNRTTLRFREDGTLSVNSKTTTNFLSLSEPPGGPITQYLQLPAPLDTILFLLRNEDGEQNLPVRLDVPPDGVGGGQIAGLVANTLGVLITDALSAAPLRVLGPLANVAGALGLTSEALTAETVTLEFAGGAATLASATVIPSAGSPAEAVEALDALASLNIPEAAVAEAAAAVPASSLDTDPLAEIAAALKGNPEMRVIIQAELGDGDLEVAARLANPKRESIESLIALHRQRKATLERERSLLAARTRALVFAGAAAPRQGAQPQGTAKLGAGGQGDEHSLITQLQSLDAERATIEHALDGLFGFLRPGAERRAGMRTRNAALALANQRLERVRLELVDRVGLAAAQRIDTRRARYRKATEKKPLPPLGLVTITPK